MAYTARQLITRAWYLSGIVARGLQTVTGDQLSDGLFLLNALLDWKAIETNLIPYYTPYEFSAVVGQEEYFIPNLYEVECLTFNNGVVRYSTEYLSRCNYFGSSRVDNIKTLPWSWTFNRVVGGANIYLYFIPDSEYPINFTGKFGLTNVDVDTDMLLTYDPAYIEYLRYSLAEYMCSEYGITMNPESKMRLKEIKKQLTYVSPPDLRRKRRSMLTMGTGLNWGDVNIGRGWRP